MSMAVGSDNGNGDIVRFRLKKSAKPTNEHRFAPSFLAGCIAVRSRHLPDENLTSLDLGETQVTDAGLKNLKELKNRSWLYLGRTQTTGAGIDELRKALPKCNIAD
jgi:hypothetical protein